MEPVADHVPDGIVRKRSPHGVDETVARLRTALEARAVKLFTIIDHRTEAVAVGMSMPETKVAIFGNPRAGTPVMLAAPLAALDLPLRTLVYADGDETWVVYTDPGWLASRYGVDADLAANLMAIHALTDAAVSP